MALIVDDLEAPKDLFSSGAPDSYPPVGEVVNDIDHPSIPSILCFSHLLELIDFETWRELQCNIAMQLFFQFGQIWVVDRKGSLKNRDWEGQNYLEKTASEMHLAPRIS